MQNNTTPIRAVWLALCAGAIACGNATIIETGSIEGKVTASKQQDPAIVVAGSNCALQEPYVQATVAGDGTFVIKDVPIGLRVVVCEQTASDGSSFAALSIVEVQREATAELGVLTLRATGSIAGTVNLDGQLDHNGVTVAIAGTGYTATTDREGAFEMENVPVGNYSLDVSRDGYWTASQPIEVLPGEQASVNVTLDIATGPNGLIQLNNGIPLASSRTVPLSINHEGEATVFMVSTDKDFTGEAWRPVTEASKLTEWTFDSDGRNLLYARFADSNGLETSPRQAAVQIDSTVPVISAANLLSYDAATGVASLRIRAHDEESGLARLEVGKTSKFEDTTSIDLDVAPSVIDVEWPVGAGTTGTFVRVTDRAGHHSETTQIGIECDDDKCAASGCLDTVCGNGQFCSAGECMGECIPECSGRECGDDGCGGTCGKCNTGGTCEDGTCDYDGDDDGFIGEDDCDDSNPNVYRGAEEICDGIDNNCDGEIDTEAGLCGTTGVCHKGACVECADAATPSTVGGPIAEDTVWCAGSPINVTSTPIVLPDVTLTIQGGTELQFADNTGLEVRGTLNVRGNPDADAVVTFTSAAAEPTRTSWNGIAVENQLGGKAHIRGALIEHARRGLGVKCCNSGGPVTIHESTLRENDIALGGYSGWDIEVFDSIITHNNRGARRADKVFWRTTFSNNGFALDSTERMSLYECTVVKNDVGLFGGRGTVSRTLIANNAGPGVQAFYEGFTLEHNTIVGNGQGLLGPRSPASGNTICANNGNDVELTNAENFDATGNYWCTTDEADLQSRIIDVNDDTSLGRVTVSPLLAEPAPEAPPMPAG